MGFKTCCRHIFGAVLHSLFRLSKIIYLNLYQNEFVDPIALRDDLYLAIIEEINNFLV
jgi:hypothetical protein